MILNNIRKHTFLLNDFFIFLPAKTQACTFTFFSLFRKIKTCGIAFKSQFSILQDYQSRPQCCNTHTRSKANGQHNILETKTHI